MKLITRLEKINTDLVLAIFFLFIICVVCIPLGVWLLYAVVVHIVAAAVPAIILALLFLYASLTVRRVMTESGLNELTIPYSEFCTTHTMKEIKQELQLAQTVAWTRLVLFGAAITIIGSYALSGPNAAVPYPGFGIITTLAMIAEFVVLAKHTWTVEQVIKEDIKETSLERAVHLVSGILIIIYTVAILMVKVGFV